MDSGKDADKGVVVEIAPAEGEEDLSEWKLVNARYDNRYGFFDELPWPPEYARHTYEWRPQEVVAYVQALGDRQKAFEADVNAKLAAMQAALRSTGLE
jgi:hypothetical protein